MRFAVLFTLALTLLAFTRVGYSEHVINEGKKPQFLFVMSAKSGSFDGKTVTLNDVPTVIYFSDRPNRIAGHVSLNKFVENWNKGSDSFKADPPNATLSIFDEQGNIDVVIEISNPQMQGESLKFNVSVLSGNLPKTMEESSLFVDRLLEVNGLRTQF